MIQHKYFCGYLNNDVIQPLCIILPQWQTYNKFELNRGFSISALE